MLELVREQGIRAITPTDAPRKVELTIFPKTPEDRSEENNNSVGIRAKFGGVAVLLPDDAEAPERRWWSEYAHALCAGCDILKLAHHGSRNGTDARWLALVAPHLAVASMGAGNEFGHPHAATLTLLAREGVPLLRTDEAGTISVTTDGKTWEVTSHRHEAGAPKEGPRRRAVPEAGKVDLNTGTEAELESLPGIGPVLARRIIEARPFRSVEDLSRVRGIGPKRLEVVRAMVKVGPDAGKR